MTSPNLSSEVEGVIFEVASTLDDPELRAAYLEQSYRNDHAGFVRMNGLLKSAREAVDFFIEGRENCADLAIDLLATLDGVSTHKGPSPANANESGAVIGRYRLLSRIGEGGCGLVYEARQEEPVRRRVAVKIIRVGMDSAATVERFASERQVLGSMDHPHIARLFDGGTTPDGRLYFVMELVRGTKITSYCDEHRLGLNARLALFIQVCNAIQHAHQKGIVHRDIKPSNILVVSNDNAPAPKVIDFGISIPTDTRFLGRSTRSSPEHFLGTPAYMSPEQVAMAGIDVDTRSDVYSLGVLLHELLVSQTPFDTDTLIGSGMPAMRQTIRSKIPPAPSQVLSKLPVAEISRIAALRKLAPAKLASCLKGDLDWIVLKALEKDPNNRHQTVSELATDIQCYLQNIPIAARRSSRYDYLRKFIRRNRLAVASGLIVALALIGGLGTAVVLYLREKSALHEQARLGRIADVARRAESKLRTQAQARENIGRVAILLNVGEIGKADALLRQNPLDSIEPSPEAAFVFRSLAEWTATNRHWEQALQCLRLLYQANLLDEPAKIIEGTNLLEIGPAMLELGRVDEYEKFRDDVFAKHGDVKNPVGAEHILKICLLTPADKAFMEKLKSAASICADNSRPDHAFLDWEALSLALYHHRLHQHAKVLEIARPPGGFKTQNMACEISMSYLASMACAGLGDIPRATEEKKHADTDLAAEEAKGKPGEPRPADRFWFDWSVASLLGKEAAKNLER